MGRWGLCGWRGGGLLVGLSRVYRRRLRYRSVQVNQSINIDQYRSVHSSISAIIVNDDRRPLYVVAEIQIFVCARRSSTSSSSSITVLRNRRMRYWTSSARQDAVNERSYRAQLISLHFTSPQLASFHLNRVRRRDDRSQTPTAEYEASSSQRSRPITAQSRFERNEVS